MSVTDSTTTLAGNAGHIKDLGEYTYFTMDVCIKCSPEELFEFLKDPWNLEKWTKVFRNLRTYQGNIYKFLHDYQGLQEDEDCYCELKTDKSSMIVDFYWGDEPGTYWGYASSRVIPFNGKSIYVFSLFRFKEKVGEKYRNFTKIIQDELNLLKNIMEKRS